MEEKKKSAYEKRILDNVKSKWNFIKPEEEEKTPVEVKINGRGTSSQRKLQKNMGTC